MSSLRVVEAAHGERYDEGFIIRYLLDDRPEALQGAPAREIYTRAVAAVGLLADLPAILAEVLGYEGDDVAWLQHNEVTDTTLTRLFHDKAREELDRALWQEDIANGAFSTL